MHIATTGRLCLREFTLDDAPFVLRLLNEPGFIANIADRGVRSIADAERYLADGPMTSYARHGFGLWMVELLEGDVPVGMCGLIRREGLADVDIGYALLAAFEGSGYAREAGAATVGLARERFALQRVVAIVSRGHLAAGPSFFRSLPWARSPTRAGTSTGPTSRSPRPSPPYRPSSRRMVTRWPHRESSSRRQRTWRSGRMSRA